MPIINLNLPPIAPRPDVLVQEEVPDFREIQIEPVIPNQLHPGVREFLAKEKKKEKQQEALVELETMESTVWELDKFCLPYSSAEELNRRLHSSVILVNERPYIVVECDFHRSGVFDLIVTDSIQKNFVIKVDFNKGKIPDLRTPPAQYVYDAHAGTCWYLQRVPARVYKQGLCPQNTRLGPLLHDPSQNTELRLRETRSIHQIMGSLSTSPQDAFKFGRMSKHFAQYTYRGITHINYKGRYFGSFGKHDKRLHPLDPEEALLPWIEKDLYEANLLDFLHQ